MTAKFDLSLIFEGDEVGHEPNISGDKPSGEVTVILPTGELSLSYKLVGDSQNYLQIGNRTFPCGPSKGKVTISGVTFDNLYMQNLEFE